MHKLYSCECSFLLSYKVDDDYGGARIACGLGYGVIESFYSRRSRAIIVHFSSLFWILTFFTFFLYLESNSTHSLCGCDCEWCGLYVCVSVSKRSRIRLARTNLVWAAIIFIEFQLESSGLKFDFLDRLKWKKGTNLIFNLSNKYFNLPLIGCIFELLYSVKSKLKLIKFVKYFT